MRACVCDIETNRLWNPDTIWVIVCRDIDDETKTRVFLKPQDNPQDFVQFASQVELWVGHNFIGFDKPNLEKLLGVHIPLHRICDTLVVSRLLDYGRDGGHSLEAYGEEFGIPKVLKVDYSQFNDTLVNRCIIDTLINLKVYYKYNTKGYLKGYLRYIASYSSPLSKDNLKVTGSTIGTTSSNLWTRPLITEHKMALICHQLHVNGFYFQITEAKALLKEIEDQLLSINNELFAIFPPRAALVKEVHPRRTKYGTLNRKDFRFVKDGDLSDYSGDPFSLIKWVPFNPDSTKQLVRVLNEAGWKPTSKTKGHIELERELSFKRGLDLQSDPRYIKLVEYRKSGYKIDETNLSTLPASAPEPAKKLANRILLESRRRTLVEWIALYNPNTFSIHGQFNHIGSWTHRMSHTTPNTANIPREDKLYGSRMRALWGAAPGKLLIGVDAVGIQLRVLAHYINDDNFTKELLSGDVHTLNKQALGSVCKDREVAKTFIYAWLLGAGVGKIAEILECTRSAANSALDQFTEAYPGLKKLKEKQIPQDAARGYFKGLDGRLVKIWGKTESERRHLAMSGYLQNGEVIVMKEACILWNERLADENIPFWQSDLVHDEYQTVTINDMNTALYIANVQAESIRQAGELLNLNCPMDGSFTTKKGDYTIGPNWLITH